MIERYEVNTSQTAAQEIDGEAVIINFQTYYYYGLNRTGTVMWKLLQSGGRSRDEITEALVAMFRAPSAKVASDVNALIDRLLAEGLLQPSAMAGAPSGAPAPSDLAATGEYVPPQLEKHEKLEQLMLSGE